MAEEHNVPEFPRPWFYRPEFYYAFFIFPPVWSVLYLRSPWNNEDTFRSILTGGLAWAILIVASVFSFRWIQDGSPNVFIFLPGVILTLVTQVQWTRIRAERRPPPAAGTQTAPEQEQSDASSARRPSSRRRRRVRR